MSLAGLEFPGVRDDQILPLTEEYLADVERVVARYPSIPSAAVSKLLSEVRRLGWELENSKKLARYWKMRCGGPGDGVTDGV